ncbi:MAG: ABC transporter substrate-binding protein, partial [Alphaproteobacteria bacterium]|nr:ABC transporter substrate-binding protein [Alphaproteobacteria bacterium]
MLSNKFLILSILGILLISPGVTQAEKMHGLAMHGVPKYDKNFTHLSYVNPSAPKGGTLRFGSYGSFDNLNRVAFKGSKASGLGYINDTLMRRVWDEAFTLYGLM